MKRRVLALAAASALSCSAAEETPAPEPPATRAVAPPTSGSPGSSPSPPDAPRPADAANGARIYATLCASCHGAGGTGDGPVAAGLDPRPARHDDGGTMNGLSNEHLAAVIKLGGPAVGKSPMMAAWGGTLSDQEIRDVIAFTRSLADPPYEGPPP